MEGKVHRNGKRVKSGSWAVCFCVVEFDIEIGQKLRQTVPKHSFSDEETTQIAFSAFPDCNSHEEESMVYFFRVRRKEKKNIEKRIFGERYYYAFVYFSQKKDARCKRGYLQKSIVLLTKQPYVGLYKGVLNAIGQPYFKEFDHVANPESGSDLLLACYKNMMDWPTPEEGVTYELPVIGSIFRYRTPLTHSPHIIDATCFVGSRENVVSNMQSIHVYRSFERLLPHLWAMWEMILVGEPLVVLSDQPSRSSDAVLSLVSLISPLVYMGDYRPYFTIHDPDFKKLSLGSNEGGAGVQNMILGVTNPFFRKMLDSWPHHICLGPPPRPKHQKETVIKKKHESESFISTYQPLTPVNKNILSKVMSSKELTLTEAMKRNEILRRHFLLLTENFMVPLERYFTSLLPLASTISPLESPPMLRSWSKIDFLESISPQTSAHHLSSSQWGGEGIGAKWFSSSTPPPTSSSSSFSPFRGVSPFSINSHSTTPPPLSSGHSTSSSPFSFLSSSYSSPTSEEKNREGVTQKMRDERRARGEGGRERIGETEESEEVRGGMLLKKSKSVSSPYVSAALQEPVKPSLSSSGTGGKGTIRDLYEKFMETPTFEKWYSSKKKTAIAEINVKHAEVLASCDFSEILRNADEMDVIECYIQIEQLMKSSLPKALVDRLVQQHTTLARLLSPDLRLIILQKIKQQQQQQTLSESQTRDSDSSEEEEEELKYQMSSRRRSFYEVKPATPDLFSISPPNSPKKKPLGEDEFLNL